jgi:hypothetical protein
MKMARKRMRAKRLAADYRLQWLEAVTRDRTLGTRSMQVALAFSMEIDWGGPEDQTPDLKAMMRRTGLSEDDVIVGARQLRDRGYVRLDGWPERKTPTNNVIQFPTIKNFGDCK